MSLSLFSLTCYTISLFSLQYELPSVDVAKKTLWLSVWDWDRFGRNSFLGEVRVPLSELDLSVKMEKWWPLYEKVCIWCMLMHTQANVTTTTTTTTTKTTKTTNTHSCTHSHTTNPICAAYVYVLFTCCPLPTKDLGSHSHEHTNVPAPNPMLSPTAPSNVTKEETPVISAETAPTETPQEHVASIEQETSLEEKIPDDTSSVSVPPPTQHEETPSPIIVDQPSSPTSSHIAEALADQTDPHITETHNPTTQTPQISVESSPSSTVAKQPEGESPPRDTSPTVAITSSPKPVSVSTMAPSLTAWEWTCMSFFLLQNLKRVGSVESFTSFYSTVPEKGDYTISGEVLFGVEYSGGKLLIHVNKARDIAAADKSGTSDSYVKTYLLPDKKKETKKKTKVVKKTLYPVFNETLKVLCVSLSIFSYLTYYLSAFSPVRASFSRCGQEDTLVECVGLG